MRTYTVRDIPESQYKRLRIIAAEQETSINKMILLAIEKVLEKEDKEDDVIRPM